MKNLAAFVLVLFTAALSLRAQAPAGDIPKLDIEKYTLPNGLEVIAGNVSTRTELAAVSTRASLGYGALFSPPRLVRHEIAASSAAAAAA